MKAWVHRKKGDPRKGGNALQLVEDHPAPQEKGEHQVKIAVKAAALNPVFSKGMTLFPGMLLHKPLVPESDFAGEIVSGGGGGTSGFRVGDRVFGQRSIPAVFKDGHGTLAEYTIGQTDILAHVPENVSWAEAAAFPLAGTTAWQALVKVGGLKKGANQRVFVNGGSAGTGMYGVQIAKAYGAYVATTKSPSSEQFVEEKLRPDAAFDYRARPLAQQLKERYASEPFDIIFDCVGSPELYYASPAFLKKGGVYADVVGKAEQHTLKEQLSLAFSLINRLLRPVWLGGTNRTYKFVGVSPEKYGKEALLEAAQLMKEGKLRSYIDTEFAFKDARQAYEKSMSGRAKGKVVVVM